MKGLLVCTPKKLICKKTFSSSCTYTKFYQIPDDELLKQLRDVSADAIYDTIEFNEFLQMMSKQQIKLMSQDSLKDAFSIFDKDDDGFISVEELRSIMKNLGDKMSDEELDEMIDAADTNHDGLVNYLGIYFVFLKIKIFHLVLREGCAKSVIA